MPKRQKRPDRVPLKRPPGRLKGTLLAISPMKHLQLLRLLRDESGPVNLAATAKAFGISRGTLHRYISEEPGLSEAIEQRRKAAGRGYVAVRRGTRATRAAAKEKLAVQRAEPRPKRADPVSPLMQRLLAEQEEEFRREAEWRITFEEDASPEAIEEQRRRVAETLKRPGVSPELAARRADRSKIAAAFKIKRRK
jgi:hypothetical protein